VDCKQEAFEEIGTLLSEGKLKHDADILRKVGLDKHVESLNALFDGKTHRQTFAEVSVIRTSIM
jgi:hypothetical protein